MKCLNSIVSTYSNFKSLIKMNDLEAYLLNNPNESLCIIDQNLRGFYKFYQMCIRLHIKPIIALTVQIKNDQGKDHEIVLVAKNNLGLKTLMKISTQIKIEDSMDFFENEEIFKNLFCVIPSYNKYINDFIKKDQTEKISSIIEHMKNKFANVYLGLEMNNLELFSSYQSALDLEILPMLKICFFKKEDYAVFDVLSQIEKKDLLNNETYSKYYFKSEEELEYLSSGIQDLEQNYLNFIDQIEIKDIKQSLNLPKYSDQFDSNDYLREISIFGLNKRLKEIPQQKHSLYYERLKYELEMIKNMHFEDYFLIVYDCIHFSRKNDILVGPGRGSSAGSLVCYCLGITNIDSIEYDLYFERFLNPERITMPDIDLDFPDDKRESVLKYLADKYGKNHVASINTFVEFGVKSSIRDVSKILQIKTFKIEEILKKIDSQKTIQRNLLENREIGAILSNNSDVEELLRTAGSIEGLMRQTSTHAAGIILNRDDLWDVVPLERGSYSFLNQTQLEASDLEDIGLLKIDFLAITNLTIIHNVTKLISKEFDIQKIPFTDTKTFQLLGEANTIGIFQLESDGIRNVLLKMKPESLENIAAVIALYRPGPMENIDQYIERKNGAQFQYIHPDLEPILKNTYGIIVYQEQILKILHDFAGYSLGEADVFRRYISKKNEEKLRELEVDFINKCKMKKYSEEIAKQLFYYILKFANYGFNKSHSVSYAFVCYQMAYLKANYPLEFFSVYLNFYFGGYKSSENIFQDLKKRGVVLKIPRVNQSQFDFVIENGEILFGLKAIRGLSNTAIKNILSNNNYLSFVDFVSRTSLNVKDLEILVGSGYFDIFEENRLSLLKKIKSNTLEFEHFVSDVIHKEEKMDLLALKNMEQESLGINIKYDLFELFYRNMADSRLYFKNFKLNEKIRGIFYLIYAKVIKTKNDSLMAILKWSDGQEEMEGIYFNFDYQVPLKTSQFYHVYAEVRFNEKNKIKQLVLRELKLYEEKE